MQWLDVLIALSAGVLVGLAIGIPVGRRTSAHRTRAQALETELEEARTGASVYREEVAAHFTKTSELVQSLTLQYRAVHDHLADGVRALCPERMTELTQGDATQALLAGDTEPVLEAADSSDEFVEPQSRRESDAASAAI
jgi:hypothetical protein